MAANNFVFDERLDTQFLETLYEDDTGYATVIFEQFIHNFPLQLKEIEEEFRLGNIELFRQKIHKVKPTFSFVGLSNLTNMAENIEKRCREIPDISFVKDFYEEFKDNLRELIPIVEKELERLKM